MDIWDPARCACFTGHRQMDPAAMAAVSRPLIDRITELAARGIVGYYAGGALGFDFMAAITVLNLKAVIPDLALTLALPCRGHMDRWRREDRALFSRVMDRADRVVYVSEAYRPGCMQMRNRYMVDRSSVCLADMTVCRGGTYQTVCYAEKKGIPVIRLTGEGVGEQISMPTEG